MTRVLLRLRDQLARLCGGEAHTEGGPRIHAEPAGGGGLAEGHHGNATMPHRHISHTNARFHSVVICINPPILPTTKLDFERQRMGGLGGRSGAPEAK